VFLDRDGVLVEAFARGTVAGSARSADELQVVPGAADAIATLHRAGALCLVVTNQPDVARGELAREHLDAMHDELRAQLGFDDVLTCPHDGRDDCECRKPRPGMLLELARRHRVEPARSWMVGDRWVDIAAGAAIGLRTVLVDRPYSWATTSAGSPPNGLAPDHRVADVGAAAALIAAAEPRGAQVGGQPNRYSRTIAAEERTP
jgi:D-glycero-D-manno-heptose 1,7-bisphosphate phosphatase